MSILPILLFIFFFSALLVYAIVSPVVHTVSEDEWREHVAIKFIPVSLLTLGAGAVHVIFNVAVLDALVPFMAVLLAVAYVGVLLVRNR